MSTSLSVFTAVADLTPLEAVPMGGKVDRGGSTRHIHSRLEANIVVLGQGDETVVLVSVDTLFVGPVLTNRVLQACANRFGTRPERVLILASHTHFAPMIDTSKPHLGEADPSEVDRQCRMVTTALQSVRPESAAFVRVGRGRSDRSVNRRRRWPWPTAVRLLGKMHGDIYIDDNPAGPRDPRIRTCVWLSEDGTPIAAFWAFACHPVGFPEPDTASADYIGMVREALRGRLGRHIPVIFAPGCMGDVRPRSPAPRNRLGRALSFALLGKGAAPFDRASWNAWATGLSDEVVAIDMAGDKRPVLAESVRARMVRIPMSDIFDGETPTPELHGKTVRIFGVGRVIALSCEPVTAIADLVRAGNDDLVLGYEGDVFGYLPTDAMVAEGGYEAGQFQESFGLSGSFRPGLDRMVSNLGRALADLSPAEA